MMDIILQEAQIRQRTQWQGEQVQILRHNGMAVTVGGGFGRRATSRVMLRMSSVMVTSVGPVTMSTLITTLYVPLYG